MTTINECNTAVLNPTGNDWSHSIVIESGEAASEEWCFCSLEPFSGQRRFQVTYNFFRVSKVIINQDLILIDNYFRLIDLAIPLTGSEDLIKCPADWSHRTTDIFMTRKFSM